MAINRSSLAQAINAVGPYEAFVGSLSIAAGLASIGATEGDIEIAERWSNNDLTTERTADAVHHRQVVLGGVTITMRLVDGDPLMWNILHPLGNYKKGGSDTYQDAVTTTLFLAPDRYLPLSHPSGGAWSPAAAEPYLWSFWKATPIPGTWTYGRSEGGKRVIEVSFECLWDGTRALGSNIYSRGTDIKLVTAPIV